MSGRGADDNALLRKLADGRTSALGALYDRHATALYRWLLAKGLPRGDAEDLLSECFLALVDRGEGQWSFPLKRGTIHGKTRDAGVLLCLHARTVSIVLRATVAGRSPGGLGNWSNCA